MSQILAEIPRTPIDIVEFILIGVLFRGVFSKWLGVKIVKYILKPIVNWSAHHLVRTEREIAIWLHYRNKAMNKGHNHKNAIVCEEGTCRII